MIEPTSRRYRHGAGRQSQTLGHLYGTHGYPDLVVRFHLGPCISCFRVFGIDVTVHGRLMGDCP